MRVKLPESAPDRKRSFGGTAVSTLLHSLLIGGAVAGTGVVQEALPIDPVEQRVIYVAPHDPPRETPPVSSHLPPVPDIPTNIVPETPPVAPPDLSVVPTGLPPATSTIGTVSAEEFARSARDTTPPVSAGPASDEPFTEVMVERPVQARSGNPAPRYPTILANAGVQGTVFAQFVVDTAGRVEPSSIRFLKSDHAQFERSVQDALLRSRYSPAEAGGRRVRQLVEQAFSFALAR